MILKDVVLKVLESYVLPITGVHGIQHWMRMVNTGRELAVVTGADIDVCELFAVLHDSQRINEGKDYNHGSRAAIFAKTLGTKFLGINKRQMKDLCVAMKLHTDGVTKGYNETVLTCWDMDRLDLGRVGYVPDPKKLCTRPAKNALVINWCYSRSVNEYRF